MLNDLRPNPASHAPSLRDVMTAVSEGRMALIDVREETELRATGKAKGAHHIPLALVSLRANPAAPDCPLPAGLPIAVYCASGGRSGMAVRALQALGYDQVHNVGGFADWHAAGGQVERA